MLASVRLHALIILALVVALSGCDTARPIAAPESAGDVDALTACTYCHGDASRAEADALLQAAPPRTASGAPAGAPDRHLHGGTFRTALACAECHAVPRSAGHQDGKVDLAFGALARTGGASPAFAGGTCSGVYCHGATLAAGGADTSPSWAGAVGCTSCHAYPPPSHAAADTGCATCHPGTVHGDGTLNLAGGLHVNGVVDVGVAHPAGWEQPASHGRAANGDLASCRRCHGDDLTGGTSRVSCDGCHGSAGFADWRSNCTFCHGAKVPGYGPADLAKAAPPRGTQGETATSARAVGAHQKHLSGGTFASAVACSECHAVVPADLTHVDGTAVVSFGDAARRGGASPAWNGTTCASTYCHGATLGAGGTSTAPAWTASLSSCTGCHAVSLSSLPRRHPTHSGKAACGDCHAGYTSASVDKAVHVNGAKNVGGSGTKVSSWNGTSCANACHGSESW
jgi:predicted CxxxxCH...CXXCH cytochrome family protein